MTEATRDPLPDPSQPLENARWESYALARSKGLGQAESWYKSKPQRSSPDRNDASLRVSGHRAEKKPEVFARIEWLIAEGRKGASNSSDALSRQDILKASVEVSDALESAYRMALETSVSPQAIERLKSVWAAHLARQGKMEEPTMRTLDNADESEAAKMTMNMEKLCTCQTV